MPSEFRFANNGTNHTPFRIGTNNRIRTDLVDAPVPIYISGSDTLVFADNFDSYNTFSDAVSGSWFSNGNSTIQDTTTSPSGANLITSGRIGGNALRLRYYGVSNGSGQEAVAWGRDISDTLVAKPAHTFYMEFWTRITPRSGATLDSGSNIVKVKWLELWKSGGGDRAQFNTTYQTRFNMPSIVPTNDGTGTFWSFFGSGSANTFYQGTQIRGPYAKNGAGQWHKVSYEYRTNSASGARDGIARMWYDGVLIVAVGAQYAGVIVPHNDTGIASPPPYWCLFEDVDAMFTNETVSHISLGSVMTGTLWPFDIDYDDMIVWRRP